MDPCLTKCYFVATYKIVGIALSIITSNARPWPWQSLYLNVLRAIFQLKREDAVFGIGSIDLLGVNELVIISRYYERLLRLQSVGRTPMYRLIIFASISMSSLRSPFIGYLVYTFLGLIRLLITL